MKRSITKTVLFHTRKKYDFTLRSVRDVVHEMVTEMAYLITIS